MYYTIESAHEKVEDKYTTVVKCLTSLQSCTTNKRGKTTYVPINIYLDELATCHDNYLLEIADALTKYYSGADTEANTRKEYFRVLAAGNYVSTIDRYIGLTITHATALRSNDPTTIDVILNDARAVASISIPVLLEKKAYDTCKCGARMIVKPDHSVLECPQCGRIKDLAGTVFRDEQFHPQDGQKTKHGGYDTSRHYKFHIERLQALENKTFDDTILSRIEQVIRDDGYDRKSLNCEKMRIILRDTRVSTVGKNGTLIKGTKLNDHAPLLVKMCGGKAPPILSFKENQLASLRFSKIMALYDQVVPEGGNKPYYPYFIFKIIEHMFRADPTKLRLIDYIHLQSRDTVIKHDKIYEQICLLADPDDGLVYTPTNRHYNTIT